MMFMPFFFLIFIIKAYVVGFIDKSMLFIWVPTTFALKRTSQKYSGCNLKTEELLNCVLIGVCEVIRAYTIINA